MHAFSRIRFTLLPVLVVLSLGACSTPTVQPTPAALAVTNAPAPTLVSPTNTLQPTNTAVPPSATSTRLPTNTLTPTVTATATFTPTPPPPTATATNTSVPPTATNVPPTATRKPTVKPIPPTPKPAASNYTVMWKTGVQYNARTADSFWCQFHNQYQNLTAEEMPFQTFQDDKKKIISLLTLSTDGIQGGYQPVVGIANPDGSINRWQLGGWYAKALGWPNGIEQFPPNGLAPQAPSDDWTWYGVSHTGEYCRYAYVKWKGETQAAEYAPDGALTNTHAALPAGAP